MTAWRRWTVFASLALFWAAFFLVEFTVALISVTRGEVVTAVGGVIGGIVGAGGAVYAVYLTLERQKKDESDKVADAVRAEVTALVRYIIGAIEKCESVVKKDLTVPHSAARYIVTTLPNLPIVYGAVADRVGLLPHVEATVDFYMRIMEAKAIAESLATSSSEPKAIIRGDGVTPIADCLLLALFVAQVIVADYGRTKPESKLSGIARDATMLQITHCLSSAPSWFPNAKVLEVIKKSMTSKRNDETTSNTPSYTI